MPAGSTYTPIATNTLTSAQADVTFSSISGSYTDLVVVINTSLSSSSGAIQGIINADTGSNYSFTRLRGNGSSASSDRVSNTSTMFLGATSTTQSHSVIYFQNYSNTTTFKTSLLKESDTNSNIGAVINLYRSTSAITSIKFINNAATNFVAGSTFTLYGIASA
jgi:hypothetical protein